MKQINEMFFYSIHLYAMIDMDGKDGITMLKAYVFRMYPNEKQKEYKETGKSKSVYEQIKYIPYLITQYPWLKECDSCALRNSLFNLEFAYKSFYNGNSFSKYKKKGIHESYKTSNNISTYKEKTYNSIKLDLETK